MRHTKVISIDEFIGLWENVYKGKYDKVAPNLGKKLAAIWRDTVLKQFEGMKKNMSWGDQSEIMTNLSDYVKYITTTGIPALPRKPYKTKEYMEQYPYTYRGRENELLWQMQKPSTYNVDDFDKEGNLKITVTIPKKEGKNPDAYRWLEAKRSLVTASFVLAWPKMLKTIIESIGTSETSWKESWSNIGEEFERRREARRTGKYK